MSSTLRVLAPPGLSVDLIESLTRSGIADTAGGWASLPEVALRLAQDPGFGPDSGIGSARHSMRALASLAMTRTGPELTRLGHVLLVSTSVQTRRVLDPVRDGLAERHGAPSVLRLPRLTARGLARTRVAARELRARYRHCLTDAAGLEAPELDAVLLKIEGLARRAASDFLATSGIQAVIVATQHNGATRAVLSAANRPDSGVTSFYVPHAPVASNVYYEDLPTHRALLRGSAEASYYEALGADPSRLSVIGDPSRPRGPDILPSSGEIVYAPSPHPDRVLGADIELLGRMGRPLTVSLHPRMSLDSHVSRFPSSWTVVQPGSTIVHLQTHGALAVAQHGSGVGLDALGLGIDVIDLCHEGGTPNYPYIREPQVQSAHDEPSLLAAVARLEERRRDAPSRIEYARGWTGGDAVHAVRGAVEAIARAGPPVAQGMLLDRWGRRTA